MNTTTSSPGSRLENLLWAPRGNRALRTTALKGSGKAAHQEVTSVQRDNAV